MSQVEEVTRVPVPFWIVAAGGKYDFTAKWWEHARWQTVVDAFAGRILFVQVGEQGHHHPPLRGVLDLRGKTDLRQLVRLVHHAQGVLCPVTLHMHLAAAVPVKPGMPKNRPCVVVAGGREPSQWEAYPHHQYLHTKRRVVVLLPRRLLEIARGTARRRGQERRAAESLCGCGGVGDGHAQVRRRVGEGTFTIHRSPIGHHSPAPPSLPRPHHGR